jgi:hypothetical protein
MTTQRAGGGPARVRARDAALRHTRGIVAGIAAGAVVLSGAFSVVAAHAFKGHPQRGATAVSGSRVPSPEAVPPIAGDPAPLEPPAQPPAAAVPEPSAPEPQVSGGS